MPLNIVLIEPEIPNNTGNIGRLALASGSKLHLVKPFGFELTDKKLKRAGLDYWQHISVSIYENQEEFFKVHDQKEMVFFSSHGERSHWDISYSEDLFLIFGKESVGLPKELLTSENAVVAKIPLKTSQIRSLNLANAVAIAVYEGLRQLNN
ncbi:tRNA (uridine(34)/cytosine(34)/5-carboxymethylaminomethyluridine(34)-2'-O)-methyltransferase TrmL [Maribacter sp. 4U21]|uniref:tRNA (cytidine(34)-2'-O)-methyltransferase n=1 Tax=Maribacter sp. 4U21 TaxID=1889779 RepID=UPI000C147C27|nr:tRNA (cytidine(34)-2'-O)-methyltransferase [Maribacter sp. 4U21]PIB29272.1 tRNA (uridine(34)/cytosine(34)/5-carboxymethylaminomethyluridine(34)-2'-O)-methyltransferase TrmL [Maribacter sp. 4U21]